ncbi:MAG TPA: exopolysaccharide biosynthesis polyprenyl glycosylphosphotransferase [Solirubrobacterales bacterium]|nr:exopolysaccharide biosynthesis polyprenyl glycosylphosphotransferase [Solirubrobacterales bacterium]
MPKLARTEAVAGAPAESRDVSRVEPVRGLGTRRHGRWWRDARRRRLLALADVTAATIATAATTVPVTGTLWAFLFIPLWPLLAKLFGLYDRDHKALRHLTADEVPSILAWVALTTTLVLLGLSLTPADSEGLGLGIALFVAAAVTTISFRALTRWLWWKRTPPELVGLVGDGPVIASLQRKLELFREMHLELAAVREIDALGTGRDRERELGELTDRVDRIVVAATGVEADLIGYLKDLCHNRQVKISVVSPLRGKALPSQRFVLLADLPILEYNTWDPSRSSLLMRRLFDVAAASLGLLLFAPFAIVIAIAIKLDSPGPVVFSQIRAGAGGRPFRMYKLRTMRVDAEAELDELIDIHELDEPAFKLRDDPRITRVGALLRRLSIDEVPQLINVLVGEMSIVGPRPEQVEVVERYTDAERVRLSVKPGVTGPMQVFGRGELSFSERLAVEIQYIENPSLGQDLRILIHTLPAVVRGTGAF